MNEYDRRTLYPMFLKYYHHLHPLTEFVKCLNQIVDEDSSVDIFQQIAFTSEPSKKPIVIFVECEESKSFTTGKQFNPRDWIRVFTLLRNKCTLFSYLPTYLPFEWG